MRRVLVIWHRSGASLALWYKYGSRRAACMSDGDTASASIITRILLCSVICSVMI